MKTQNPVYVARASHGGWRVNGSRVSLDSIVHAYWEGRIPEAIAADFPSLSLEQIHGAIAFYLRNRHEIDLYLAEQDKRWKQSQHESASRHAPLLKKVRATVVPGASVQS